jgi:hypothetical protein
MLGARPRAGLSAGSCRPARREPNVLRDPAEVIVGEPVPAQAQLPGQGPLAEPLAAGGSVLADSGGVTQQARWWPAWSCSPSSDGSSDTVDRTTTGTGDVVGVTWPVLGVCGVSTSGLLVADPSGRLLAFWRVIFTTSSPTDRPANAAMGLVAAVSRSARMTGWPGSAWMWPMFPATLTARPIRAVAQGQIRCRAGQPSR